MRKIRWQLLIIFLAGLVVGILLLTEQPVPSTPLDTPEPERGGVYTEALIGSFQRLNPLLDRYSQADRDVDRLIFSGLIRFDSAANPQPDLAQWGVSADGTLYNLALRKDIRWHDGKPFTADDVIFTIELMRNGGNIVPTDLQEFWKAVEVVRLSEYDLQFRLPAPFAPFLDYLTFGILPKHLLENKTIEQIVNDPFNLKPVGTGPYQFSRLIVENGVITGVVLSANQNYYGEKPYLDEIVFRYYPDSASALQAYQDKQVQGISEITSDVLEIALAEPNLAIYSARQPILSILLLNLNNADVPFFQNKDVRKALMLGLNRQGMIDVHLKGQAILANGPILPGTWAYYATPSFEYEPQQAKTLLEKAGYVYAEEGDAVRVKGEKPLAFTLLVPDTPLHLALAEEIRTNWNALGVQVTLEPLPYDQLVQENLKDRAYQAALVDLNLTQTPDPDPYPFWDQAQISGDGQNYSQWDNRMASEYLEQARVATNRDERTRYYRNFQVIFHEELPALPLFYRVYNYGVSREIGGVRMGPLFDPSDRFAHITEWYLVNRPRVVATPQGAPTQP